MDERYIVLDIGGRLFKTKLKTLISIDGSFFQQLFTAKWDHLLDSAGHLFIDRDGDIFPVIIGYLRHGKSYPLPFDNHKLSLIIYEAKFYKLPELVQLAQKVQFDLQQNFTISKTLIASRTGIAVGDNKLAAIAPPLPLKSTDDDELLLKRMKRKLSRILPISKNEIEIGPPKEFKHIVHIGQADHNGHRVIIDHSGADQATLKATVQAIYDEISPYPVVYSLVDANENENHSESVEIFFSDSTIRAFHNSKPSQPEMSTSLQAVLRDNSDYQIARNDKTKRTNVKIRNSPIVTDI
uniref:CRIB domain-containing protein n=1 Tax=Setaria digitata TaxID=48799 RepID=A0A915Q1I1_9BILA